MTSAYIIADVTVNNPAAYEAYKKLSTIAMKEHGVEVCIRGGEVEVLEGDWAPHRVVLLKFADVAHARTFYNSTEYRAAIAARKDISVMRMVIVEGI
jgi:uncharacterized protein (DUF1330 family)